ncbi:MAG: aminopeptidase P family protein [Rikenellaceae bacterium]|nr:aminopeptidase P family protein [Rikenellaceae bacterium]
MFEKELYISRRNELRKKVRHGLVLLLGNEDSPANYPSNTYHFRQDSNFLYFFGINRPGFAAVMDVESGTDCLYANDISLRDIVWTGPQPSVQDLSESCGVKKSFKKDELNNVINIALKNGRKIHFLPPYRDTNVLRLKTLLGIKTDCISNYVSADLIKAVVSLREIKGSEEITQIENACKTAYEMHTAAMKLCRPGITEKEIGGYIEGISLSKGHGVSFLPIVTQNGETLHDHSYKNKLRSGKLLLIDAGAETDMNYCSDFTRTFPVNGKFTDIQKSIYNIVLAANNKTFEIISSGITFRSVHLECAKVLCKGLKDIGILHGDTEEMVENGVYALFMPHGLGHQMGLDVHDMEDLGEEYVGYNDQTERSRLFGLGSLRMAKKLKQGHVLTVEPGIYFIPALIDSWKSEKINSNFIDYGKLEKFKNFGGIRIEDNALVTDKGCRILGKKRVPVTVEEIENFMAI